ncbi:hypothetical protein A2U01_0041990 [Trifolium medium]|uniref:Uncharacterized protein n=1 Tax=Trifolium medium TaxID=97028 RepID=A0A392QAE4_9FABA|nr:hypothetical protein [Trifolium medium]
MKRGNSKAEAQAKKKKPEEKASTTKLGNAQRKLKMKEESSESAKTDSDWTEYLKTYDPKDEDSDSEEICTHGVLLC